MAKPSITLLSTWFCPYGDDGRPTPPIRRLCRTTACTNATARPPSLPPPHDPATRSFHRAAQRAWIALNHRKIPYTWVEALDWHPDGEYKKVPLLLEANPNGLIPTIIGPEKKVVNESLVCIEFADDLASVGIGDPNVRLLPADPYDRARCRIQGAKGLRAQGGVGGGRARYAAAAAAATIAASSIAAAAAQHRHPIAAAPPPRHHRQRTG